VKHPSLGLFLGVATSAALLAACGSESPDAPDGPGAFNPGPSTIPEGTPMGQSPGNPQNPGTQNPGAQSPGTTPTGTEGNPTVPGLEGNNPPGAQAPGATPGTTPPGTTPPVTPPPGTTVVPGADEPTDCVIPAPLTTVVGYGSATTGGGNAAAVSVSTYDEAQAVLDDYRDAFEEGTQTALVLRYTGTFDYSTITDVCVQHTLPEQILEVKEVENVTIEGARGSSVNFGIKVTRSKNIIIRNMTMGLLPGGGSSDAITLEGNDTNGDVENVWVDHNTLFSSTKSDCEGAGDTEFDGLIDIKKGARRITVSYNHLHDHQKTGLLGSSDDDLTERYVTFHHNRYENVESRTPLHRNGFIHVFNNYFGKILSSGINVRMGGVALIESNFFEDALNPVTSRYSPEPGFWDLRNNHIGPNITWDVEEDTLANADTWQSTTTFPESELNYAYAPDRAGCVKQIVFQQAGANLDL
jgi:pectate lyase